MVACQNRCVAVPASLLWCWLILVLVVGTPWAPAVSVVSAAAVAAVAIEDEQLPFQVCTTPQLYGEHPMLCQMLDRRAHHGEQLAAEITAWARAQGLLIDFTGLEQRVERKKTIREAATTTTTTTTLTSTTSTTTISDTFRTTPSQQLPVVFAHGMGDSCFNDGMQHITKHTASLLGDNVYSTCIPTGKTRSEDTNNGYFLNMDASVDVFAAVIQQDVNLAGGFHAIGFSQGNNVIRGYIGKYNTPPVNTFLSINGVNGGVGAVPYCQPKQETKISNPSDEPQAQHDDDAATKVDYYAFGVKGGMCDLLMEQASRRAYTEFSQQHLFQANYWRDPRPVEQDAYRQFSQLAQWGNEGRTFNQSLKDNWSKTNKFIWVLATQDAMVWPREGEQWGTPDPQNPFHHVLPMNQTEWYQKDLFGLKTAQEAGKNYFESFEGDHLQFSMEDFDRWVTTYLSQSQAAEDTDVVGI
jgi:palmitoyl-protein thioesterase